MKCFKAITLLSFLSLSLAAQKPSELMHTYSIVARDTATGRMGVAVQSHWFGVGSVCPWLEAGVGAIATQSFVNVDYGSKGLSMLKSGGSPEEILNTLSNSDELKEFRQVAILSSTGEISGFTGKSCVDESCQIIGDDYAVQANMMLNKGVCKAMKKAFEKTEGAFEDRLMEALLAAQEAGGDIRGKQSAAMKIVEPISSENILKDVYLDIRVDDHRAPLRELKRLVQVNKAYRLMNQSDEAMAANKQEEALMYLAQAAKFAPRNLELKFWTGVTYLNLNQVDPAWEQFLPAIDRDKNWSEFLIRLKSSDLISCNKDTWDALMARLYEKQKELKPAIQAAPGRELKTE